MWGSVLWVPRVPSILLLSGCFCNGYHGYQVCPVLGCGVAIYGYHGYQVCPVVGCGGAIYGYHGYQLYFFCVGVFVMGTTGTKYVLYSCVGERFMGTTGTKYTSSV